MLFIVVLLSLSGIILIISSFVNNNEKYKNIIDDYKKIKECVRKYNKEKDHRCRHINDISNYINEDINIKRYSISSDGKWLIVKNLNKKLIEILKKEIKTDTKVEGNNLYISFFNLYKSTIIPKAVITMKPSDNIYTTTTIEWDYKESVTEGDFIKNFEWEGKKERYSEKGEYRVKLRIQDRNDNWSEWTEKVFKVKEIEGIRSITCGGNNLFIVYRNGKVEGLGQNKYGQLGTGLTENLNEKGILDILENVKQISSGEDHTLILQNNRKVKAVGRNNFGQLGNGDLINSTECVNVWGMEEILSVSAGKDFSAALTSKGEVMMWGNNEYTQLGEYDVLYRHIPKKVDGIKKVKQIALGHSHVVALLYDKTVVTWGSNIHGECGTGLKCRKQEPSVLSLTNVKYVACGKHFSFAVLENGKVYGWGINDNAQLGIEEMNDFLVPIEIPGINNVDILTCKNSFTVALTETGRVYTWGMYNNDYIYKTPTQLMGIKYAKDIASSNTNGYLLTENEEVLTWNGDIENLINI